MGYVSESDFNDLPRTIAVVGVGLMGGSLGLALKRLAHPPQIVGIGRDRSRLDRAIARGAIDTAFTDLAGVGEAEMVVVCTTIQHILDTLPEILSYVGDSTTVTDVGSTKAAIVAKAAGRHNFVGSHPMAGSERAGVDSARADLYDGATWAVTPAPTTSRDHAARVQRVAEAAGARVIELAPEVHDAIVAITSHVPHVLASALVQEADTTRTEHPDTALMTAGSFADMTRIAASPPEIWRDVCLSNRDAVLQSLDGLTARLDALRKAVDSGEAAQIEAFFAAGYGAKTGWPGR